MTDTVSRQSVIDAVRSVPPGTTCRGDAIIAAINAIPAVDEWQPIETAHRDGANVLLAWLDRSVTIGRYDDERFRKKPRPMFVGHFRGAHWMRENQPTHWCPLPNPELLAALGE